MRLLALVLLLGCPRQDTGRVDHAEGEVAEDLPPPMSPGTLLGLGPQTWVATFRREGDGTGRVGSQDISAKLIWSDIERFEFVEYDGEDLREHEIRLLGQRWRRTSAEAPWVLTQAPPPDALRLSSTTSLATESLNAFINQLAWERVGEEAVDGRPAVRWHLGLAPAPLPAGTDKPQGLREAAIRSGQQATPVSLDGDVWVDLATGNRLRGRWSGSYLPLGVRDEEFLAEVKVSYEESRTLHDAPPLVTPPKEGKVIDRSEPPVPQLRRPPARPRPGG
jgi:hypothetical protein